MHKKKSYQHLIIEPKWQKYWYQNKVFKTSNKNNSKKKYVLDMFPYPSGAGLHVGHPIGYTATDIISRYFRLNGYDVLHPMGWDAFGLPAEQFALKTGKHPEAFTLENIKNFKRQIQSLGFSYDWDKEINTSNQNYYQWTQWIFKEMYKKGLAILKETEVNWCPQLGTVLANEEIIIDKNGNQVSERGNFPVYQKMMKQWVLKITNYAEKLFAGLDNLEWSDALKNLQRNWIGKKDETGKINLHLRDWIFARQRYWGEPFPLAFDENGNVYLIDDLVSLPYTTKIKPSGTGESPLANLKDWLYLEINNKKMRRETSTMPQWAGSCWYYLAYILKNDDNSYTPINSSEAFQRFQKWLPVDIYVGGQEHAVMHLLYARFWHKVLYDLGIVPNEEPFLKLVNQGMVLGTDNQKMSKSKGNVINPDQVIHQYGADTLRVYEMFMGAFTDDKIWSHQGIEGINRWLKRVWRLVSEMETNEEMASLEFQSQYHLLIKEISSEIINFKFNLAISKLMVFVNNLYKNPSWKNHLIIKNFLILLSPFAPHLAEELLEILKEASLEKQSWPKYQEEKILITKVKYALSINSRFRALLETDPNLNQEEIIALAKKDKKISSYLKNQEIKKIIFVKDKIVNFLI